MNTSEQITEKLQFIADLMTRVHEQELGFDLDSFYHNIDAKKPLGFDNFHNCGTTACVAGYVALTDEFKADSGVPYAPGKICLRLNDERKTLLNDVHAIMGWIVGEDPVGCELSTRVDAAFNYMATEFEDLAHQLGVDIPGDDEHPDHPLNHTAKEAAAFFSALAANDLDAAGHIIEGG